MTLAIRLMRPEEATTTSAVVMNAFNTFNAAEFTPEGIDRFAQYASVETIKDRQHNRHTILVAEQNGAIVGVIETRQHKHVSMLFVHPDHMKKGVSKALWERALALCKQARPGLEKITVNSSTYAAPVYEKFGFVRDGEGDGTVHEHGLIIVPMTYTLTTDANSTARADFLQALRANADDPLKPLLFEFRNLLSPIISGATFLNDAVKDDAAPPLAPESVVEISAVVLDYATRLQSIVDALQTYYDETHDDPPDTDA